MGVGLRSRLHPSRTPSRCRRAQPSRGDGPRDLDNHVPRCPLATPTEVSFPLYTSENQYLKRTHKRETWYGATVFEALRGSQPFNAGAGLLHPLHILQFLSNTDKHRLLNIVAHNQVNLGGVTVVPEPAGGVRSTVNDGVVGQVLFLPERNSRGPNATAAVDLKPVFAGVPIHRSARQRTLASVGRRDESHLPRRCGSSRPRPFCTRTRRGRESGVCAAGKDG